jgi:hypothetical protein
MLRKFAGTAARRLGRQRFLQARYERALDLLEAAHVDWREASDASVEAHDRCYATRGHRARHAFLSYFAALDREAGAAAEYAACVERVCDLLCRYEGLLVASPAGAGSLGALLRRPKERL